MKLNEVKPTDRASDEAAQGFFCHVLKWFLAGGHRIVTETPKASPGSTSGEVSSLVRCLKQWREAELPRFEFILSSF